MLFGLWFFNSLSFISFLNWYNEVINPRFFVQFFSFFGLILSFSFVFLFWFLFPGALFFFSFFGEHFYLIEGSTFWWVNSEGPTISSVVDSSLDEESSLWTDHSVGPFGFSDDFFCSKSSFKKLAFSIFCGLVGGAACYCSMAGLCFFFEFYGPSWLKPTDVHPVILEKTDVLNQVVIISSNSKVRFKP